MSRSANTSQELAVLERLIRPRRGNLPASAARAFLKIDFEEQDRQRMHELSRKAQEGKLTIEEVEVMEMYDRLGHFLSLIHSKARRALQSCRSAG